MKYEELAAAWLKLRVEELSEMQPQWSRSAYTHRRTPHVAFANGAIKREGEVFPAPIGTIGDVADATLKAIKDYRATISGPVLLTWRCEPEITQDAEGIRIYCRLAFEPDIFGGAQ